MKWIFKYLFISVIILFWSIFLIIYDILSLIWCFKIQSTRPILIDKSNNNYSDTKKITKKNYERFSSGELWKMEVYKNNWIYMKKMLIK